MKPWHFHTHDEKLGRFAKPCSYCGKVYVDHVALWVHEAEKCRKRPTPESDSTASATHGNPKSDKLTSCPTDLERMQHQRGRSSDWSIADDFYTSHVKKFGITGGCA